MFTLLGIGGTALAAIIIAVLTVFFIAVGVIRRIYPEKKHKPLKRM